MNHQLRTTLPTVHNPTQPPSDPSKIKVSENHQTNQPHRNLQPLAAGDSVRFRGKGAWDRKGVVLDKCKQLRSYHIVTNRGTTVCRNRRHQLHTKESIKPFEHFELMDFELEDESQPHPQMAPQPPPQANRPAQLDQYGCTQGHPTTTRSGRIVRRPHHLTDFADPNTTFYYYIIFTNEPISIRFFVLQAFINVLLLS